MAAPVDLITAPDTHHGAGPGMMMQMGPARRSAGATERLMQFKPDPALKPIVTRLPRALATLAAPDVKSAVAWRTFELNPMMGMGMMGMRGMGGQGGGPSQMMGINGRSFAMDRIDVTAKLGTSEIWEIVSSAMPMAHPFHIHGASFRILSKDGRKPSRARIRLEGRRPGGRARRDSRPLRPPCAAEDAVHVPLPHPRA